LELFNVFGRVSVRLQKRTRTVSYKKTLKAKLSSLATVSHNGTRKGHGVYQKKKSLDPTQDEGGGVEKGAVLRPHHPETEVLSRIIAEHAAKLCDERR
jgi:hypothetical protein